MSRSTLRTLLPFVAVVAATLAAAACGSQSGSLLGPSAGQSTATVSGTVDAGGVAASSSGRGAAASDSGIRVSVVGSGLSTMTDPSGRFVISGIPAGTVTLRFEAPGIDARLELGGLVPGQTLTVAVRISGGRATLAGQGPDDSPSPSPTPSPTPSPSPSPGKGHDGQEIEFTGSVESINPPDLTVAGRVVHTDGGTEISRDGHRIALADLSLNERVEVEGTSQADGSVLAREVQVKDKNDQGDDDDHGGGDDDGDDDDDGDGHK